MKTPRADERAIQLLRGWLIAIKQGNKGHRRKNKLIARLRAEIAELEAALERWKAEQPEAERMAIREGRKQAFEEAAVFIEEQVFSEVPGRVWPFIAAAIRKEADK